MESLHHCSLVSRTNYLLSMQTEVALMCNWVGFFEEGGFRFRTTQQKIVRFWIPKLLPSETKLHTHTH